VSGVAEVARRPVATAPVAVMGVDGGNSKVDIVLADAHGRVLSKVRGPTISHQQIPVAAAMTRLDALVDQALVEAGLEPGQRPVAQVAAMCLAGADHASEVRLLTRAIGTLGLAPELIVRNDTFAALRAGSHRSWGVGVICGAGINAIGVAPDGRVARFAALGQISGDRAGGDELGWGALGAAVRARDGRGPRTMFERTVPAFFGLRTPAAVTGALYRGEIAEERIRELAPLVYEALLAGDEEAIGIADAMADEVVAFVSAAVRRLHISHLDVPVVLAGSVLQHAPPAVVARITAGVRAVAPGAIVSVLDQPPVLGSMLLALDQLRRDESASGVSPGVRHQSPGA
jgi:N-acetylglucosamine kinase-like BadF-type ATPase